MSGHSEKGKLVAYGLCIRGDEETSEDLVAEATNSEEDARRLVACWNAFQGVSTDRIEALSEKPLLDLFGSIADQLAVVDDALDANRYRLLRDLQCGQLNLLHDMGNAREWIEELIPDDFKEDDPESIQEMKDKNSIWTLQVYPCTQTGFELLHGATLDSVVDMLSGEAS